MSESPSPAVAVELVTLDEARELLAALELLEAIADRSIEAAYTATSALTYPRTVRAQDYGRLTAVAGVAADAIFNAVLAAGNYCSQDGANQAMTERSTARAAGQVAS